jgi:GTP cyclohydrolase I
MSKFLKDIQNLEDKRGIDIQKVGIKAVEVPLLIQRKDEQDQIVSAQARMSVDLPAKYKGTHMSRFINVLNKWSQKGLCGVDIRGCLEDLVSTLNSTSASIQFKFKYFVEKQAPVTCQKALMGYDCSFEGGLNNNKYNC